MESKEELYFVSGGEQGVVTVWLQSSQDAFKIVSQAKTPKSDTDCKLLAITGLRSGDIVTGGTDMTIYIWNSKKGAQNTSCACCDIF